MVIKVHMTHTLKWQKPLFFIEKDLKCNPAQTLYLARENYNKSYNYAYYILDLFQ